MKKKLKKKRKTRYFRLNFYCRQLGMLEKYKPLTPNLVTYYINQIRELYHNTNYRVKIYIEDSAGYTKEQIIPHLINMPPNVKFVWGKRKVK